MAARLLFTIVWMQCMVSYYNMSGCHACCLDAINVVSCLYTVNVNRIPAMMSCMVGECRPDALRIDAVCVYDNAYHLDKSFFSLTFKEQSLQITWSILGTE
jgi:hypothetical protein